MQFCQARLQLKSTYNIEKHRPQRNVPLTFNITFWWPLCQGRCQFHPILVTDACRFADVLIRFWVQKVKGQRSRSQQAMTRETT